MQTVHDPGPSPRPGDDSLVETARAEAARVEAARVAEACRRELARLGDGQPTPLPVDVATRAMRLRHQLGAALVAERAASRDPLAPWPRPTRDPFPGLKGVPEVGVAELGAPDAADLVGGALAHHGSLLVRGLLPRPVAEQIASGIAGAFAAHDEWVERRAAGPGAPPAVSPPGAFVPFRAEPPYTLRNRRPWVRSAGAVWAAESPVVADTVLAHYDAAGLRRVLRRHLGDEALLSVNKFTLRRVDPDAHGAWHQDGSFLGSDVRAVNVWVALTACGPGERVPALDLVAGRVDDLLPTGTHGSTYPNSIGPGLVAELARSIGISQPSFSPGDALVFDDRLPHSTAPVDGAEGPRYAIESWFFAPRPFPEGYVPLAF